MKRFVWLCLPIGVVGCSAIFDVSDYEVNDGVDGARRDSGATDRDAGDEDVDAGPFDAGVDAGPFDAGADGGAPCPAATHRCVPSPEGPWMGPVAVTDDSTSCAGSFPSQMLDLFTDLRVPSSSCRCNCGSPTQSCPNTFRVVGYSDTSCSTGIGAVPVGERNCYSNTASTSLGIEFASSNAGASCAPGTVTPNLATPVFDTSVRTCGGFAPGPGVCDSGDQCVPRPVDPFVAGRLCVYAAGEQTCPDGYPERSVVNTGFSDSRACPSGCSCTSSGASCSTLVRRFSSSTICGGSTLPGVSVTTGGGTRCLGSTSGYSSIRTDSVIGTPGSCRPGSASVTGDVTPNGAHTICCSDGT